MTYVLRLINAPGKSARADQATAVALTIAASKNEVQMGAYLEWSDPDANRGMGEERWTNDLAKAKRFADFTEAMECWRAQSTVRPLRPDGKPNRPLTAYSVTPERIDDTKP
jgi:hypothetical protein